MSLMKRVNFATFFTIALLTAALPVAAATLVNINTADLVTLETLNGIGASKGQAIIDYRTQHGSFAAIEDIMNVSGIGTATYNNIKDFITVGSTATTADPQPQTQSQTQTQQTQTTPVGVGNPPPALTVEILPHTRVFVGGGSYFEAKVFGQDSLPLSSARCIWNFGDGVVAEGCRVLHTYRYPGTYSMSLTAAYNYSAAVTRSTLQVVTAQVGLVAEGDGSLTIKNLSTQELDVGLWSLLQGAGTFTIPEDTRILPNEGVRFSPMVLGFVGTADARLLYPNSVVAASAAVGANSPLRGERIVASQPKPAPATPASQVPPRQDTGEVLGASTDAKNPNSEALLFSLLGLAGVIGVGATAAYLARPRNYAPETSASADEFSIED